MPSYDKTIIWQQTLGAKVDDIFYKERERLRVAYENIRQRAKPISEAISKDLPEYTVHDITHSDALWEYADLIVGPRYPLNPVEAFVLGCAFLIHDLGMGLAVYPSGIARVKQTDLWRDIVANLLGRNGVKNISENVFASPGVEIERKAISEALRRLHSQKAGELAFASWVNPQNSERFDLIEDQELRDAFGTIIGKISASHGESIEGIAMEFNVIMGAKPGFPHDWTIDPLKLACILRCADYAHIDERRAPSFLCALRNPTGISLEHWGFQSKLYQPRLEGDRLIYTTKTPFKLDEAQSWWLCFDTIQGIDAELRRVDSLLADMHRERFCARGVSQAESAARIAKLIGTDGWQPVDTKIHVSAVAELVDKLGGKDLYGEDGIPPLRELIQNAADAVRARRVIDQKTSDWGEICITTGKDSEGRWIQIDDNGIGMSQSVLTGPFLDFGTSFWGTPLMHEELPGLASKGFISTGKYGIGFFSVFMWGKHVEVLTQRYDKGRDTAQVLIFKNGLKERPLLRKAAANEYMPEGGTRVKVWFADEKTFNSLISSYDEKVNLSMSQVCAGIAPCLDVTVKASNQDSAMVTAVAANDWETIPDTKIHERVGYRWTSSKYRAKESLEMPKLQLLRDSSGVILGRVALVGTESNSYSKGIIAVGGLRSADMNGVAGVFVGAATRAARDEALPLISKTDFDVWLHSERDRRISEKRSFKDQKYISSVIALLGGDPEGLIVSKTDVGWVTISEVKKTVSGLQEILMVSEFDAETAGGKIAEVQLKKGVFLVESSWTPVFITKSFSGNFWPESEKDDGFNDRFMSRSTTGVILRAVADVWQCSLKELVEGIQTEENDAPLQREVGTLMGNPFVEKAQVVTRPRIKK